ncbi:MAG TPA: hypothetical protein VMU47_06830 [Caldimonas sp.]|nr:hypothetical protein [Caldimonas sp.]
MSASWGQQLAGSGVTGAGNGTTGPFDCPGGRMSYAVCGTFGGCSVQLNQLGPDGTTWLPVGAAVTSAGVAIVELAPCQLQLVITGGAGNAIFASIARVLA